MARNQKQHVKFMPTLVQQPWVPKGSGTRGQRVHECGVCGKVYTRAEHLRRHQALHPKSGGNFQELRGDLSVRRPDGLSHSRSVGSSPAAEDSTTPVSVGESINGQTERIKEARASPGLSVSTSGDTLDLADRKLIHHWLVRHSGSVNVPNPPGNNMAWWLYYVPQACSSDRHIRHLVLGMAGLDLASLQATSIEAETMRAVSVQKTQLAIHFLQEKLQQIDIGAKLGSIQECDQLALMVFMLNSFVEVKSRNNIEHKTDMEILVETAEKFNIRTGLHLLREKLGPLVDETEFFKGVMAPVLEDLETDPLPGFDFARYNPLAACFLQCKGYREVFQRIDRQYTSPRYFGYLVKDLHESSEDILVIWGSVLILEWVYELLIEETKQANPRVIARKLQMRWRTAPSMISKAFMDLVRRQDPHALAVLILFASLGHFPTIKAIWWEMGHAKERVKAIARLIPTPQRFWMTQAVVNFVDGQITLHEMVDQMREVEKMRELEHMMELGTIESMGGRITDIEMDSRHESDGTILETGIG